MKPSPRQRFLSYVRNHDKSHSIISPFLPHPSVIKQTLEYLKLPVTADDFENEIALSQHLNYEPMFMTELSELIFNWQLDESQTDAEFDVSVIPTPAGDWIRRFPKGETSWNDTAVCPIQTEADHELLLHVCQQVGDRENEIRTYYRNFRQKIGENGVTVIGHPHPAWLGFQISPEAIFYQWNDYQEAYIRSMDAVYEASLFVMSIAIKEGIDFMSDSSYGLEMTSPALFKEMDLPYIQKFAKWTHDQDGLFWYHNCGFTRQLIKDGYFNTLGADVVETIAPQPEGDNDLTESRQYIDSNICTKGNFNLTLLRDGNPDEIIVEAGKMVNAVKNHKHIFSTADAVLPGTPPENFIAFIHGVQLAIQRISNA